MDPFFDIDIPRIERSAEAAIKRTKLFRDRLSMSKRVHEEHPELGPVYEGTLFHFDPSQIVRFLKFLGNGNVSRKEKEAMRQAANILTGLLDKGECLLPHCKDYNRRYPCSCYAGRNPQRCAKVKAYKEKKHAEHAECQGCGHQFSYGDGSLRCSVKRNSDRPENCPKIRDKVEQ